jgi:gas vesicle protein
MRSGIKNAKPEKPHTMSSRSTSFLMLVTGIAAGAALGLLFAPQKGRDTRADLRKKGVDVYKRLKDLVSEAQDHMAQQTARAKEKVNEMKGEAQRPGEQARSSAKA